MRSTFGARKRFSVRLKPSRTSFASGPCSFSSYDTALRPVNHPRKLIAELAGDLEILRVEVDLDVKRVTVWMQRIDREEPQLWEFELR